MHLPFFAGMQKAKNRRVQRLSWEGSYSLKHRRRKRCFGYLTRPAINRIPDQPVTRMGQMRTDLMRASGFKPAGEER